MRHQLTRLGVLWLLGGLLWLAGASVVFGATYYVDATSGNDANAGTSTGAAWRTPPGTRNTSDSGWAGNGGAWGSIDGSPKIACGDVILLKGGTTHSSTDGGPWKLDSTYYTASCGSNPIQIRVATNAEWSGSTGDFTFNTASMTVASGAIEQGGSITVSGLTGFRIGGISATQRLALTGASTSHSGGLYRHGWHVYASDKVAIEYFEATDGGSGFSSGAVAINATTNSVVRHGLIERWSYIALFAGPYGSAIKSVGFDDILIRDSGFSDASANAPNEGFIGSCPPYDNTFGGGGGVWFKDVAIYDHGGTGFNAGGNNSCTDATVKGRGLVLVGNGWASGAAAGGRSGYDYAGRGNGCEDGDDQYVYWTHSIVYGNFRLGGAGPHGSGQGAHWNMTYFQGGMDSLSYYDAEMRYSRQG